jgi:hypothetical protein
LDEALIAHERAHQELGTGDRAGVTNQAVGALILALMGKPEAARAKIAACLQGLEAFSGDISMQRGVPPQLARAHWHLGEVAQAREKLESYLENSKAVLRPHAHYYLGLCAEAEGNLDTARTHWQTGVDLGYGISMTALCAAKLSANVP